MDDVLDVLVIGSGAAGLAAAVAAREAGAESVLVAEADDVVGGSSRLSGGLVMGAGTRFQEAAGIEDSPDQLFADYMNLNQWDVDPGPVRRLADTAGETVEWVADLGVQFYPQLVFGGNESQPRVHVPDGRGQHIIDVLHRECNRLGGVDIALRRRVDRLLVEDGQVSGAAVGDDEIRAHSVIVASGGFGNNPDLLKSYYPSSDIEGSWYIGADGARGDAIGWASSVGAQLTGENRGLRLLDPGFVKEFEAYLPGWLVMVDPKGRRFLSEVAPYGIVDRVVATHGDEAWMIFDSTNTEDSSGPARYKQQLPSWSNRKSTNWNPDMIAEQVEKGLIARADTIEELAEIVGLPPQTLAGTVARYNGFAEAGKDEDYHKSADFLDPLVKAPFHAARVRPTTICWTGFGMRIDADARVLDELGGTVPGLYAAGEATGGVMGTCYVGSGNSYANSLTFGRIAGDHAARSLVGQAAAANGA